MTEPTTEITEIKMTNDVTFCGLDFGTSNSTIGGIVDDQCQLLPLERGQPILPTAVFYNFENKTSIYGQLAIDSYAEQIPGRLMKSLKSLLGSSLIEDKTILNGKLVPFTEVIGSFIKHMKDNAERKIGRPITHVVAGRPVSFHKNPLQDKKAQKTYENILHQQGFECIRFKYEPFAAALDHESKLTQQELALIVDIGGGTSDFTIIRLDPMQIHKDRTNDVLANYGVRVGGTDFDSALNLEKVAPLLGMHTLMRGSSSDIQVPTYIYHDLTSWHFLRKLYTREAKDNIRRIAQVAYDKAAFKRLLNVLDNEESHRILMAIEDCKKNLSTKDSDKINLNFMLQSENLIVTKSIFNDIIMKHRVQLLDAIAETMRLAGVSHDQIQSVYYTGGSTKILVIRDEINALFPQANIIYGDAFGSVGKGLTIDAFNTFSGHF